MSSLVDALVLANIMHARTNLDGVHPCLCATFTRLSLQRLNQQFNHDSDQNLNSTCNTRMLFCVQVNSTLECSFLLLKGPYEDVRITPVIYHHFFSNDSNETDYVPLPISDSVECNKLLAAKNINLRLFIFQVQK